MAHDEIEPVQVWLVCVRRGILIRDEGWRAGCAVEDVRGRVGDRLGELDIDIGLYDDLLHPYSPSI